MSLSQTNVQALARALFSLQGIESHFAGVGFASDAARAAHVAWARDIHESRIAQIMDEMPSGSGFDSGTQLDESSRPDRLVFTTAFHHMDDCGMYCGWTEHSVIVTPSLVFGFQLRVTGRDRREIKDYIAESFHDILSREAPKQIAVEAPS